ncbi:UNVERIFIED_CONTAM: hypothetical protein FKN15_049684 [Acipenser sinensis]
MNCQTIQSGAHCSCYTVPSQVSRETADSDSFALCHKEPIIKPLPISFSIGQLQFPVHREQTSDSNKCNK